MRITALQPQARHPERLNLFVDGEFRLALAAELAFAAALAVGDEIDEEILASLAERDQRWKAREAAYHLLAHRARAEGELRQRLERRGFAPDVVERCIEDLKAAGLIDDAEFAGAFARDRVKLRPRGARLLVQELRAKGIDPEIAGEAVTEALAHVETTELDLAREAARRWARRHEPRGGATNAPPPDRNVLRRKLYGYLARRGFPHEEIRTITDEVVAELIDGARRGE
jgi:regulatory protein